MSNTKLFFWALAVTVFVHGPAVPATAQAVRVPGTKVNLAPPDGFSLAQQYPGFERESDRAAIMVTELPGAAADMMNVLDGEALAGKGMTLVASSQHVINGRPARLLNVRQATFNGDMLKWMLIAGDQTMTIMIVGMFPADSPPATGSAIRHALLSTSWGAASPDAFEGLPFRVTPTSKLKLARRVSNMLALTESGTMGSPRSPEAIYLVGHSIGRGTIGDLRSFAELRASQTTLTKSVGNFTGRMVQIDSLDAYELEAEAIDARSGVPMRLYQVIVPDETGYFVAQGLSRADRAAELFPEFKAVTASFRRDTPR
jgi:hypothetical protein